MVVNQHHQCLPTFDLGAYHLAKPLNTNRVVHWYARDVNVSLKPETNRSGRITAHVARMTRALDAQREDKDSEEMENHEGKICP